MNYFEVGLYIHIPFCKSKCLYCDYFSTTKLEFLNEYFRSLKKELDLWKKGLNRLKIISVYLGGGTPSYVDCKKLYELMNYIDKNFDLDIKEFTIEVNPDSFNKGKAKFYRSIGINRISIGIQNFDDDILNLVKRPHDSKQAIEAYKIAREFFDNVNIDLIFGFPKENKKILKKNLKKIEELKPDHVSYYLLDLSHEVPLVRLIKEKKLKAPSLEFLEEGLEYIYQTLEKFGYERYEISNWCINKKYSFHNRLYWENKYYLGIGASAGGYVRNIRYVNQDNLTEYIKKIEKGEPPFQYKKELSKIEQMEQELFIGLRLIKGISTEEFLKKYGKLGNIFLNQLKKMAKEWVIIEDRIRLSEKGLDFSKQFFEILLEVKEYLRGFERKNKEIH